jgi:uncharacterized membrane protein YidH (DUF202 family)
VHRLVLDSNYAHAEICGEVVGPDQRFRMAFERRTIAWMR